MLKRDYSEVFNRFETWCSPDTFDPSKPWVFVGDEWEHYETEEEACRAQREYRVRNGFDPMTGERKTA